MSPFMSLPRELRDQICKNVILSQNELPSLDSSFDHLLKSRQSYVNPELESWTSPRVVQYRPDDIVPTTTNLLHVNHQLYAETLENLKLIPPTYDLDLIILDEILVLPTWIYVPYLSTDIDQLNATFRISGRYRAPDPPASRKRIEAYKKFSTYSGFQIGCGAGPAMAWQIYSVLERFFKVGPTKKQKECDKSVTIKTLNINVETPPDVNTERFEGPLTIRQDDDFPTDHVLDPEYLVHFIAREMTRLLWIDIETYEYGGQLYRNIDQIILRKDGEERETFDLAERIPQLKYSRSSRWNKNDFENWRKDVLRHRKERGLRECQPNALPQQAAYASKVQPF